MYQRKVSTEISTWNKVTEAIMVYNEVNAFMPIRITANQLSKF
jgi:hypothetical protein